MESPAWLPRREVKPPPTSTEAESQQMLLHWRIQLVTMQTVAVQFRRRQSWTLLGYSVV
ncbi:hypothetical protein NC651_019137 [Populus alba x Populus x berolinensis]|nr:hypothetical protein NC651_019137 [Populus alba x Populus x berolinensis]